MMSLFKALADPARRRLLSALRDGPRTAGEVAEAAALSAPSASYHLDLLLQAGLV
jgi:DNA-binding transcriptional ArsR family regulator